MQRNDTMTEGGHGVFVFQFDLGPGNVRPSDLRLSTWLFVNASENFIHLDCCLVSYQLLRQHFNGCHTRMFPVLKCRTTLSFSAQLCDAETLVMQLLHLSDIFFFLSGVDFMNFETWPNSLEMSVGWFLSSCWNVYAFPPFFQSILLCCSLMLIQENIKYFLM